MRKTLSSMSEPPLPAAENKGVGRRSVAAVMAGDRAWLAFAQCCLLLVGAAGGALLVWWALSFHPSNEQLWMVPVGLILLGTPIFVWLSVFASSACRSPELMGSGTLAAAAPALQPAPPPVLDPERYTRRA